MLNIAPSPLPTSLLVTGLLCFTLGEAHATDIEFSGTTITTHFPAAQFILLPPDKRAELLSRQMDSIINEAQKHTGRTNLIDIISSLEVIDRGKIRISQQINLETRHTMNTHIKFSTRLPASEIQEKELKKLVDYLNKTKAGHFIYEENRRKMRGFSESELLDLRLSEDAKNYLQRAMIYHDIVQNILSGPKRTDRQKLEAIKQWTFIQVSEHFERPLPNGGRFNDFNDLPLEIMLRGMGSCDRSAWILATLAFHAGLDAHVVYLYSAPNSISSHTVAEIKIDTRWIVVDPINNQTYEKGVFELSKELKDFKHCVIFPNSAEAEALLPIMKLAEMICRFYVPDQRFFVDVEDHIRGVVRNITPPGMDPRGLSELTRQLMTKTSEGRDVALDPFPVSVRRWDYPFWLRGLSHGGMWSFFKDSEFPFLKKLREARLQQLLGNYETADTQFDSLKKSEKHWKIFYEELYYFMILNLYLENDFESVRLNIPEFKKKYPRSHRNNSVLEYVLKESSN